MWFLLFLSFNLLMASNTFDINLVVFINYILNGQPLGKGRSEWPLEWSDVFPDLGSPDREVTGLYVAVPLSLVKFYGWIVMGQWLIKWLTPGNDPGDIADHDPEFRIIVLGLLCPCQRHAARALPSVIFVGHTACRDRNSTTIRRCH